MVAHRWTTWGLGDLEVVKLALRFKSEKDGQGGDENAGMGMRTDWTAGLLPSGYHLPQCERAKNAHFDPIEAAQVVKS